METGDVPEGLFAPDVFCDFTMPRWRCDPTPSGFVLEFEERRHQDSKEWYSRELARADVDNGAISVLSVYCTGDWDADRRAEHARAVRLLRP